MFRSHDPDQNHLLDALPTAAFERLAPALELVPLRLGEVLCESGAPLRHAYFPTTAIISIQCTMENGASAEVAGVGNEGMFGISLFMGGESTTSRAIVQTAGHGYRLRSNALMEEFDHSEPMLQRLLLRYTQALSTQIMLTGACNRHHSVLQQLCRWLLSTLDRMPSNNFVMTQELIASMLGVRREGITEAAGKLRDLGRDQLPPWPHHRAEPVAAKQPGLRMLPSGQERFSSLGALCTAAKTNRHPEPKTYKQPFLD